MRVLRSQHIKRGQAEQALGYSRGGFSSKIHVSVDALGNPNRGQEYRHPHEARQERIKV